MTALRVKYRRALASNLMIFISCQYHYLFYYVTLRKLRLSLSLFAESLLDSFDYRVISLRKKCILHFFYAI